MPCVRSRAARPVARRVTLDYGRRIFIVQPVTDADVTTSVQLMIDAFRDVPDDAWNAPAGGLTWNCWETVEHVADDLFGYAGRSPPRPRRPATTCRSGGARIGRKRC